MNAISILIVSWVVGTLLGMQLIPGVNAIPSLMTIIGFVIIGALTSVLFFGKLSPVFVLMLGVVESMYFAHYPLATILLGVCTIVAALYGKTLGDLALDDFYEGGTTRLPGFTVAAFLNFLLIVAFAILTWFLYSILPNAAQLLQWFPIAGWGV